MWNQIRDIVPSVSAVNPQSSINSVLSKLFLLMSGYI